jgi:DNA-binding transcriptional regulator YdaS (Cro superfamily)
MMTFLERERALAHAALNEAIEVAGNQTILSEHVGVTRQAVSNWVTTGRGLTAEMAVAIEQATGVHRERLVPHLFRGLRVVRRANGEPA